MASRFLIRHLTQKPIALAAKQVLPAAFASTAHRTFTTSSIMPSKQPVAPAPPASTYADLDFDHLLSNDETFKKEWNSAVNGKYRTTADSQRVANAKSALEKNGFGVHLVKDRVEAFNKIYEMIPEGATVTTAHSTTLEEIGFINYLSSNNHPWKNIKDAIFAEKDKSKQEELRRTLGGTPDAFLTSVVAVTEDGHLVTADQVGNRVGVLIHGSKQAIVVVGSNKIVKDDNEAMTRFKAHVLPAVDAFTRKVFKAPKITVGNLATVFISTPPKRIQVIIIDETLGY
ncbi:hypothetical protein BGW41_004426 [Actinomortierella wolfii]|nr:hypothetical protein BGW41_004426 [Actinomortierella wolfii]